MDILNLSNIYAQKIRDVWSNVDGIYFSSSGSGTQTFTPAFAEALIQTIAAVPDLVDMAITGALENMMAAPRAYAAAKAEEAYAAGATTFALADLSKTSVAAVAPTGGTAQGLTDAQRLAAGGYSAARTHIDKIEVLGTWQSAEELARAIRWHLTQMDMHNEPLRYPPTLPTHPWIPPRK